ncbi:MAG: hypothetical protein CL537_05950 [Alcanivoracaceae bacterium]|nr:hypothetical protein [Alcanivoracaceae bacterium]|tara:strand:- start:887 stop:1093 length:207 start_codon:yes stop_codon:yes gene_type:complete
MAGRDKNSAESLEDQSTKTKTRLDGHYTLTEIGEHFGCGRSTVNRAVKAFRGKWESRHPDPALKTSEP